MKKLHHKLSLQISLLIAVVFLVVFVLNNLFLSDYYLYEKKQQLGAATKAAQSMDLLTLKRAIPELEAKYDATIVVMENAKDEDTFNGQLIHLLEVRKISLSKFWVTKDSQQKLETGKTVSQLYNQGKLKSSYLVNLYKQDQQIVLIGTTVVHDRDTLAIINRFNLMIFSGALLALIALVWAFTNQITKPLERLGRAAEEMGSLTFTEVEVQGQDEVAWLAHRLNQMSRQLKSAYESLDEKNERLKRFIGDMNHELKTPIALIKAYNAGIRDGLDDGTFTTTIEKQADRLSQLVEELLDYARLQEDVLNRSTFSLADLLHEVLEDFRLTVADRGIRLTLQEADLKDRPLIEADREKIRKVLFNLVSNAVRYTEDESMAITLNSNDVLRLSISNGINMESVESEQAWDEIWQPFVVLQTSRDKSQSGTGLGLSIVASILERHGYVFGHNIENGQIKFWIEFVEKNR